MFQSVPLDACPPANSEKKKHQMEGNFKFRVLYQSTEIHGCIGSAGGGPHAMRGAKPGPGKILVVPQIGGEG